MDSPKTQQREPSGSIKALIFSLYPLCLDPDSRPRLHMPMPVQKVGQPTDFTNVLATLCALQDDCDSASVAISTSGEGVELYISTFTSPRTLPSLMRWWLQQLQKVGLEYAGCHFHPNTPGEELTAAQRTLILGLHRPSHVKFQGQLRQRFSQPEDLLNRLDGIVSTQSLAVSESHRAIIHNLRSNLHSFITAIVKDTVQMTENDSIALYETGRQFSAILRDEKLLGWLHDSTAVYAEDILHACSLLYIIGSTLISAALADTTRPVLHKTAAVHWISPSLEHVFIARDIPQELKELQRERDPSLDVDGAMKALSMIKKIPPGFILEHTAYIHRHSVIHCEASLLAYLIQHRITVLPHIACSQDPCACCEQYSKAVGLALNTDIALRTSRWAYRLHLPWIIPESTPENVRNEFQRLLLKKLSEKLWDFTRSGKIYRHCL